jgi:hypothetical protein
MSEQWDGRPPNPERDRWHWIESLTTGNPMCAEWRADREGWNLYRSTSEHHAPNEMFSWRYLGPCLTPAEVAALTEWRDEPPGGISKGGVLYLSPERVAAQVEAARRDEREACAAVADEWAQAGRINAMGSHEEILRAEGRQDAASDIAAAIRARGDA